MGRNYFCRIGGKDLGPITSAELRELAKAGKIQPDDLVTREDAERWYFAKQVDGLFEGAEAKSDESEFDMPAAIPDMQAEEVAMRPEPEVADALSDLASAMDDSKPAERREKGRGRRRR